MSDFINLLVTKDESQDLDVTAVIILFVNCLEVSNRKICWKLENVCFTFNRTVFTTFIYLTLITHIKFVHWIN